MPGACPPLTPVACSDDAAGCGTTSKIEVQVFAGVPYVVRVGGTTGSGFGLLTVTCQAPPDPCPADLDGDGDVAGLDVLVLLAAWGTDPGEPPDLDGDGVVGVTDLLALLGAWGLCR